MASRAIWERVIHTAPKTMTTIEKGLGGPPLGRRKISSRQAAERVKPLVEAAARGEIPIDQKVADAVRLVAEQELRTMRKEIKS